MSREGSRPRVGKRKKLSDLELTARVHPLTLFLFLLILIGLLHCLSRKRHPALPCPRDVFDSITIWSDNRVNVSATLSQKKILNVFFILLYDD